MYKVKVVFNDGTEIEKELATENTYTNSYERITNLVCAKRGEVLTLNLDAVKYLLYSTSEEDK